MKNLTARCPKPLVQVNHKALIDYAIESALEIDPPKILANLHYLPHMLENHLKGTKVETIIEEPELLETGGGLKNALGLLGEDPVITMNTDAIWHGPNPVKMALDAWDPDKMEALLICVPIEQTVGHAGKGDFSIHNSGQLSRGGKHVYGGVQIIKTDRLHFITERKFSLNLLWDQMLSENSAFGVSYTGQWCDVGRPEGIALAERMLNDG